MVGAKSMRLVLVESVVAVVHSQLEGKPAKPYFTEGDRCMHRKTARGVSMP